MERKVVKDQLTYLRDMEIGDALESDEMEVNGKTYSFSWYDVIASTDQYNAKNFMMMPDVHRKMAQDMNEGVVTYYQHNIYERPLGMTRNAKVYGKKVRTELGIQENLEDVKSNDIISRIDTGVLKETSLGFMGGRMISDITGNEMKRWFLGYYDPETGHDLGQKIKLDGKEVIVTGKLDNKDGTFYTRELSVVKQGADPGAKFLDNLSDEFLSQDFNAEYIQTISELNDYDFDLLCQKLSFDPEQEPTRKRSAIPVNIDLDKDKEDNMSTPNDNEILKQSAEDAVKEVEKLTQELADANAELESRPTQEELDAVIEERDEAKSKLAELESEVNGASQLADVGKEALRLKRETALRAWATYHGVEEGSDEWNFQEDKLRKNNDIESLGDFASNYRELQNSKRSGGRKSESTLGRTVNKRKTLKTSGQNSVYARQ